ncbi:hypothetical protein AB0C68_09160 [Streptomyces tendae]|uniref:hypothetical protein n=1 Tax=Streptomyces tendae TaxID=1932 RepID=UPI00340B6DAA
MPDPGTSSSLHPLQRPKFRELLTCARPGGTVHISEMFRLVRGNQHVLDVLDVRDVRDVLKVLARPPTSSAPPSWSRPSGPERERHVC